jgi:hypothetical protein
MYMTITMTRERIIRLRENIRRFEEYQIAPRFVEPLKETA